MTQQQEFEATRDFGALRRTDVAWAGGKGANLGELTAAGMPVPPGFVIGAPAFARFCDESGLRTKLHELLDSIDPHDSPALEDAARRARESVESTPVPAWAERAFGEHLRSLAGESGDVSVAVRSSATSEDTSAASFAGMNESFLNVRGADALVEAVLRCWSSLFGARTLYYRASRGFPAVDIDIAVVVQRQIESLRSGVMFTVDPAGEDRDLLVIEGSLGLGEAVVSGQVTPDHFVVSKSSMRIARRAIHAKELTIEYGEGGGTVTRELAGEESSSAALSDDEVLAIADFGRRIEHHYGEPQDVEWAFDAAGDLWILQSRPITTLASGAGLHDTTGADDTGDARGTGAPGGAHEGSAEPATAPILSGLPAAPGSAHGAVRVIDSIAAAQQLQAGEILVAHMTTPDWAPYLRKAAAIVTDSGGMTCHAAIVSREFGTPCVVGTSTATSTLTTGDRVTVDGRAGVVYAGDVEIAENAPASVTATTEAPSATAASPSATPTAGAAHPLRTKLLVNLSEPSQAERAAALDVDGVGLLRAELMVLEALGGDHPRLLIEEARGDEFVDKMADALATFARAFDPRPITYRTIDFRTNEFAGLRGGERFEPHEANPMIGFRGALRYTKQPDVFNLELAALKRVWSEGLHNIHVMLPFVRTSEELRICRDLMLAAGLISDGPESGPELWVMAEVPSVLFNIDRYAALGVAGVSVGTNDLTQLLLGADRDSELLSETFDERDHAVTEYLRRLIPEARRSGLKTSICGQAPSVHPEYADLLVEIGIDAISVSVDAVDRTRALVAAAEARHTA